MIDTGALRITSADDIEGAAVAFRDAAATCGEFRIILSDNIASRKPMIDGEGRILAETIFGFLGPEDRWWENGQLALYSPIAKACRYESLPFWCDGDGFHGMKPSPDLDKICLKNFEQRSVVAAAIVVPVHLPFGQIAMAAFGVLPGDRTRIAVIFRKHADRLMLLTHRIVSGYAQVRRRRRWYPADCQLTAREVQCLRGVAAGNTDLQIADRIGCSHTTIRFHLTNAREKLDAVSRSQMLFKAGQLGYLGHTG